MEGKPVFEFAGGKPVFRHVEHTSYEKRPCCAVYSGRKETVLHKEVSVKILDTATPGEIQKSLESFELDPEPGPVEGYPKFEENKVSTRTYMVATNLDLDPKFYLSLPRVPAGNRRRGGPVPSDIPEGSITDIFPERSSVKIDMVVENKLVHLKAFLNSGGKFQIAGVQTPSQAEKCVRRFWDYIKDTPSFTLRNECFEAYFRPLMCNVVFDLGFPIGRGRLRRCLELNYPFYPAEKGRVCVKIQIPGADPGAVEVKGLRYVGRAGASDPEGEWEEERATRGQLRGKFPGEKNDGTAVFLVFRGGKVNMTSADLSIMSGPYYRFLQIIQKFRDEIEKEVRPRRIKAISKKN